MVCTLQHLRFSVSLCRFAEDVIHALNSQSVQPALAQSGQFMVSYWLGQLFEVMLDAERALTKSAAQTPLHTVSLTQQGIAASNPHASGPGTAAPYVSAAGDVVPVGAERAEAASNTAALHDLSV